MLSMTIAWDATRHIVAMQPYFLHYPPDGSPPIIIDIEAMEKAGAPLRLREDGSAGVWNVHHAIASGSWPEWLDVAVHDFRVETTGEGRARRVVALIHETSGHRRERAPLEAEIARRQAGARALEAEHQARENERAAAAGETPRRVVVQTDIRDLVGDPDRPLRLDDEGRTLGRSVGSEGE